ncbi:uncharacterized protein LOC110268428 [Arachis ipaensis]|uniref:uncharacterized protein LOC110268428 n=1 Tax=Arachis ipaensis TaxID=130454 RepID=UPI000A2B816D|nr:uncharacterized protein LOC110268428 [Arachis ipaensis]
MYSKKALQNQRRALFLFSSKPKGEERSSSLHRTINPNPRLQNQRRYRTATDQEARNRTIIASHQEALNRNSPSSHHHRRCVVPKIVAASSFPASLSLSSPRRRCISPLCGFSASPFSAVSLRLLLRCFFPVFFRCFYFTGLCFAASALLLLLHYIGRLWVVICETTVKKIRGPTQCLKIHARQLEDREEITLDIEGDAIGPTDETVNNLSKFLGTVARNSDFCPLIYTNWKGIKDKEAIWEYVQAKFIIPTEGKRMVLSRINDN